MAETNENNAPSEVRIYAVRNKKGQWFRRKGYGGYGESWVDDFKQARLYTKPGPARAVAGYFFNSGPQYGCPDIVVFDLRFAEAIDEGKARAEKARKQAEAETKRRLLREKAEKERKEKEEKELYAKLDKKYGKKQT
jgi:hypothetical protein